jgi:tetratricopeptide (TPR) repeat protein
MSKIKDAPSLTLPHKTGEGRVGAILRRWLALVAVLWWVPTHALTIDYDIARIPDLRACDDLEYHGRAEPANDCYTEVFSTARNNMVRAQAAVGLRDLSAANSLYRAAMQRDPSSVLTRIAWGKLFIETHQYDEALKLFREVLKSDASNAQAKIGMAQVLADRYDGAARKLVEEVLKANDQFIEAHLLLARMDLEEGRLAQVEASLDRAQSLAEKQSLPPLEVYALRAALETVRGDDGAKWVKRALDYNPHYGSIFETQAHMQVMRRRYQEAANLLRRAVQVEPGLSAAHASLGENLLRLGQVEEGQRQLAIAYEGDPYSVTTVNTLRLLDRFNEFDVTHVEPQVGPPATHAVDLRLHRTEAAVLRPYVEQLAQDSIATYIKRYHFEPKQPITIEVYPNHDDFAVRVGGLPGVGLLGVTFGYLVAMDSPSGRASGEFHWGSTLWHEMAHVFTLELTDHHVPRWLSEGISVFEEWRTGPTPGVIVSPDVIAAFRDNKFLKIEELDSGFIRPSYENQVQVSYNQAGLTCLFIEQRYGFDKLVALLEQFKRDVTVGAAIKSSLNISAAEFDREFDAFFKQRYAKILPKTDEWQELYDAAVKAAQQEDWQAVVEPAEKSIALYGEHVAQGSPYLLLAKAQDKLQQPAAALQTLLSYRQAGGWDPEALRQLAKGLQAAKRDAEAIEVLSATNYSDPLNAATHLQLGDALLAAKRPQEAVREYQALLALNTHDQASAHLGLAKALRATGDQVGSRRNVLQALEIAPHFRPAQDMLLEMVDHQ